MATAPKAAKRPEKTEAFSKSLHFALSIFDDQITTLSDVRKTAYENFIVAYQTAFADIWPKIEGADIKIILKSVKDKELHELRSMADKLSPPDDQPELVQEKRDVPTSDAILGNLISRIPEQHPPSKEACNLISTAFQDLAQSSHTLCSCRPQPIRSSETRLARAPNDYFSSRSSAESSTCLAPGPSFTTFCPPNP